MAVYHDSQRMIKTLFHIQYVHYMYFCLFLADDAAEPDGDNCDLDGESLEESDGGQRQEPGKGFS